MVPTWRFCYCPLKVEHTHACIYLTSFIEQVPVHVQQQLSGCGWSPEPSGVQALPQSLTPSQAEEASGDANIYALGRYAAPPKLLEENPMHPVCSLCFPTARIQPRPGCTNQETRGHSWKACKSGRYTLSLGLVSWHCTAQWHYTVTVQMPCNTVMPIFILWSFQWCRWW